MTPGDSVAPLVAAPTPLVLVGGAEVFVGALEEADAGAVPAAATTGGVDVLKVHAPAGDTGAAAPPVCGS